MIQLRDYQLEVVAKVRDCFSRGAKSVLLVLPTGAGKTIVFTHIAAAVAARNKKTITLVHRVELLRQTSDKLISFDVDHGMINPAYTPNFDNNVQVASVQTVVNRLHYLASANWHSDLTIADECHHSVAGSWRKIINHFQDSNENHRLLGVTATPIRTDGQGLGVVHGGMFDEMVCGPSMKWLMSEGYLVRAKVLSPPKKFDSSKLKRSKGDFKTKELDDLINKPTITGSAVAHYEATCKGVPTIVFCVSVAHTEEVAQEFRNHGYRFYAIDGTTDDVERKRVLQGLADGTVDGVCSCDLINEGTDVPAATCGILLRLTGSLALYLQQVGRLLRPVYADGYDLTTREGRLAAIANSEKPYAYILDHVGNVGAWVDGEFVTNHGLPDEEHEWNLDGEVKKKGNKKTEKAVRIQQCLSCFATHEPAPVCPECGHVYEIKDNKPKQVEGKLLEITSDMLKKEKRIATGQAVAKSDSLEDLLAFAEIAGFKPGWAHVKFGLKEKKKMQRLEKIQMRIDNGNLPAVPAPPETVSADFDNDLDF